MTDPRIAAIGAPIPIIESGPGATIVDPDEGAEPADGYEIGGLLGRGGMGEVHVAHDRSLGREVAMKTARAADAITSARLAREARLTARLEHPNIVPIYGAGRDAAGRAYYTMRVLPGRSLADAIREAVDLPERLLLLRHVLGAADALAYAHGRGVLHRDVKPANIMVGQFGQTVVADWGLACAIDEQVRDRGGGTPGYMSPEQEKGEILDGRADVYALGAVLHEVLTGQPPDGRNGRPPPARVASPAARPELAAIAGRALQPNPNERYPGARAFADDLLAWFEGRRVGAYAYSAREMMVRAWAAWRLPLSIAGVSTFMVVMAIGVGWYGTAQERGRAEASERKAVDAQGAEQAAFAAALVAEAQTAAKGERRMEAEILAANALVRRETPEARGVLARFGGRPRMSMLARAGLPEAESIGVAPGGAVIVQTNPQGAVILDPLHPERVIARAAGEYARAAFAGDAEHLVLTSHDATWVWVPPAAPVLLSGVRAADAEFGPSQRPGQVVLTSRSATVFIDAITGRTLTWRSCDTAADQAAALASDGTVYVMCSDRRILSGPAGEAGSPWARAPERDDGRVLAFPGDGARGLLVGTTRGSLLHLDSSGAEIARQTLGSEAVFSIAVARNRVAIATADGLIGVWQADSGLPLGRLFAPAARLAWLDGGVLRVVGRDAEDRLVPDPTRPHLLRVGAGVSSIAISPDERSVAVSQGDGTIAVVDLADGRATHTFKWQDGVGKDVAFSPDGRHLATAMARGEDQRIFNLATGEFQRFASGTLRRVGWFESGWLLAAPYVPGVLGWPQLGAEPVRLDEAQFQVLELNSTRSAAAAISEDDGIWRVTDGNPPTLQRVVTVPGNRGVAPLGDDTLVLLQASMVRLDPLGVEVARWEIGSDTTDVAVSADERWIAVGLLNGDILVWRTGSAVPIARLVGHAARVAGLQFTRDGRWLLSGGWDDAVRVWSLEDLDEPGEALRTRLESEWGRTLDAVLGGGGGR